MPTRRGVTVVVRSGARADGPGGVMVDGATATRSVSGLLLDALYSSEEREALASLRRSVGELVERDHVPRLIAKVFPQVVGHADFAAEQDACIDLVASALGLQAWAEDWLLTRESVLLEVRRLLPSGDLRAIRRTLHRVAPTLRDPETLARALLREMPDRSSDADHRRVMERLAGLRPGPTGATPEEEASSLEDERPVAGGRKKRGTQPAPPRRGDPRWRPAWWSRLRSWSQENGFALDLLPAEREAELATYLDRVDDLLTSDETLHATHWEDTFVRSAGLPMNEVQRIDVHAHVVAGLVADVAADADGTADPMDVAYELLTRQAFLLGMADHVVDVALQPDVSEASTFVLERGMRVGSTLGPGVPLDEVLAVHELVDEHAAALGMTTGGVARATQVVAVTRWDLESRSVAKALRYRIPLVLIDDFLAAGMRDELECRIVPFPSLRAAACGRCGILHTRSGRHIHRLDALCDECR